MKNPLFTFEDARECSSSLTRRRDKVTFWLIAFPVIWSLTRFLNWWDGDVT
jgi:hypothetical protein